MTRFIAFQLENKLKLTRGQLKEKKGNRVKGGWGKGEGRGLGSKQHWPMAPKGTGRVGPGLRLDF